MRGQSSKNFHTCGWPGMDLGHPFNVTHNDGYNNNDDDDYGVGYNAISEATNTLLIQILDLGLLFMIPFGQRQFNS